VSSALDPGPSRERATSMSRRAWIALVVIILVAVEAGSATSLFVARRFLKRPYAPISTTSISRRYREVLETLLAGRTTYLTHSPTLGWTIKPNGHSSLYRANAQGIRGDGDYRLASPEGVLRLAAFGDSFTHGDEVKNQDTWQEALMRVHQRLEVMNFGVGGYGLDQAFLRYQEEGVKYRPHIVLIGFMSGNIFRSVNVFRPFYAQGTDLPLAKPRFVLQDGKLILIENPMKDLERYRDLLAQSKQILPRLGTHDYYFQRKYKRGGLDFLSSVRLFKLVRYELLDQIHGATRRGFYNPNSEPFKVTAAIFDQFVDSVAREGSLPVILFFPHGWDIVRYRRDGRRRYAPMLEHFRAKGYRYIDLLDWLDAHARDVPVDRISPDHYSPLGNRLVADAVWDYLQKDGLVDRVTKP